MRRSSDKMHITLIALAAVAVLLALLLFLDVFVPVFPTSLALSEDGTESFEGETKPFENVTDRMEPPISLETEIPSVNWEDLHWEFPHYTEEELMGQFKYLLEYTLILFAEKEAAEEIPPIDRVGLFDLDRNGVPEVITMGVYDGSVEYTAYDLSASYSQYPMKVVSSWGWEGTQYGELSLWSWPLGGLSSSSVSSTFTHSLRAFITHTGDGDDEYLCEFNSKMVCEERYAKVKTKPFQNSSVTLEFFSLYGQKVDETAYTESYERFMRTNFRMPETTMVTVQWNASDPEGLAEKLLTSGQWFLYDGKW